MVIGYLLGNIRIGFLPTRFTQKGESRSTDTGNTGIPNAVATRGWKFGLVTFFIDALKATSAVYISNLLYPDETVLAFLSGTAAVLGDIFPFVMKFKGGKGIAPLLGMLLIFDIRIALLMVIIGCLGVIISNYIMLGSLIIVILLPIFLFYYGYSTPIILMSMSISILAIWKHRINFQRLVNGEEKTFRSIFKKQNKG